jgi:glucose-6-phosphate isomerase
MKELEFNFKDSLLSNNDILEIEKQLQIEIERMNAALSKEYEDDRASINLLDDIENIEQIKKLAKNKLDLNPKYLIVVGIGGSNLGTVAVQEAVLGKLHNQTNQRLKLLYADTVDSDLLASIITIIESVLKNGDNVIINGVSKSGGTTETIANFEVLIDVLKKYKPDYQQYVVVTTDKHSRFWDFSVDRGFSVLEIPKKVGGRFSVFSSVGLFPLAMMKVDINQLIDGAISIREKCLNPRLVENPAAMSASMIYQHKLNGKLIHDLFLFSTDLESLGKWYRQLMGESIGKEFNIQNEKILEGITPTVSIGSTDLHSMAQLYLGGPYDKFTTFVRVKQNYHDVNIPNYPEYNDLVKGIQEKPMAEIMNAILNGVQQAFRKGNRPFLDICLPDKSPYSLGQFMQFKEMEIMYLGYLLGVNPFDQPNVEDYKIETKQILNG